MGNTTSVTYTVYMNARTVGMTGLNIYDVHSDGSGPGNAAVYNSGIYPRGQMPPGNPATWFIQILYPRNGKMYEFKQNGGSLWGPRNVEGGVIYPTDVTIPYASFYNNGTPFTSVYIPGAEVKLKVIWAGSINLTFDFSSRYLPSYTNATFENSANYTGSPIIPRMIVAPTPTDITYTIERNYGYGGVIPSITNPGTYWFFVYIKFNNTNLQTVAFNFTIIQGAVTFAVSNQLLPTYTGSPITPTYVANVNTVSYFAYGTTPPNIGVTITYYDWDTDAVISPPIYPGKYFFIMRANQGNYSGTSYKYLMMISSVPVTFTVGNTTQVYNGNVYTPSYVANPSGVSNFAYSTSAGNIPVTILYYTNSSLSNQTTMTNVGTYYFVIMTNQTGYTGSSSPFSFTITKSTATVSIASGLSQNVGSASASSLSLSYSPSGASSGVVATYDYSGTAGTSYGPNSPYFPSLAGSYTVSVSASSANYTYSQTGSNTLTLTNNTVTITPNNTTQVYYGGAYTPIYGNNGSSFGYTTSAGNISVSIAYYSDAEGNVSTTMTDVGTYWFKITVTQSGYTGASSFIPFVITKANATVTLGNLIQTDYALSAITSSIAPSGATNASITYTYTGRESTSYGPSTTSPTVAGSYNVTISASGNSNYNYNLEFNPTVFTINSIPTFPARFIRTTSSTISFSIRDTQSYSDPTAYLYYVYIYAVSAAGVEVNGSDFFVKLTDPFNYDTTFNLDDFLGSFPYPNTPLTLVSGATYVLGVWINQKNSPYGRAASGSTTFIAPVTINITSITNVSNI